jgi:hypothetical protein
MGFLELVIIPAGSSNEQHQEIINNPFHRLASEGKEFICACI